MRNRCRSYLIAIVALAAPIPIPAAAQWVPNGIALSSAPNDQIEPRACPDGLGGAIVAWSDARSAPYAFDLYVQRVTSFGQPQWTPQGVAISTASGNQIKVRIVRDGAGGAIMVWEDRRGASSDIYVQRITAAGLVQWAPGGVAVCAAIGDQIDPEITGDGAGGAIVTWEDQRAATNSDIYAQRVSAAGVPLWAPDGVGVCTNTDDQLQPGLVSDAAGGAIVTWSDTRGDEPFDIYAQRIDANGVAQWLADGDTVSVALDSQEEPKIVADGAGGAIVTWVDYRANGFISDLYAQRITAAGVPRWLADGVPVCTANGDQADAVVASDGLGGVVVAWEDVRSTRHIFVQRLNSDGAPRWAANGLGLASVSGIQQTPAIISPSPGSAIVAWSDGRNSFFNADLYAQRVDSAGVIQWAANGLAVSTAAGDQVSPTIALDTGGLIMAWEDARTGLGSDIYSQRVTSSGVVGPTVGVSDERPQALELSAPHPNPSRNGTSLSIALPVAQKVTADVFDLGGRRIRSLARGAAMPAGMHTLEWDGRDFHGDPVGSGIYLVHVQTPGGSAIAKVTVLD